MLNQPTSSPMMTRMLGFLSCAHTARADDKPMTAPINKAITKNLLLQACIEMFLLYPLPFFLQPGAESARHPLYLRDYSSCLVLQLAAAVELDG